MGVGGLANIKDGGAGVSSVYGGGNRILGNATAATTGATIDRLPNVPAATALLTAQDQANATAQQFESVSVFVAYSAALPAGGTITVQIDPEHAPESTVTPNTAGAFANVPATHQPTSGSASQVISATGTGILRYDLRVTDLERFLRFNIPAPVFSVADVTNILIFDITVALYGAHNEITRTVQWVPQYTEGF